MECMLKSISHTDQYSGFELPASEMGCMCMLVCFRSILVIYVKSCSCNNIKILSCGYDGK